MDFLWSHTVKRRKTLQTNSLQNHKTRWESECVYVCLVHISPQGTLHLLVKCVYCMCGFVLESIHHFQQHSYLHHIYQPEQPFLLGGGGGIEVVEKHNLSNIKYQGIFSWSQQEGTEMFHCSAQQSPHIFSTAEPVIIQGNISMPSLPLSLSFFLAHTHRKEEWADSQIGNQARFKQIESEADQTNKRAKLRCNHQNYLYQNEILNYNSTWNIHFEQREL